MTYVIDVPDDLDGYEINPGDFQQALLGLVETWLGPDYAAWTTTEELSFEGESVRYQPFS